MKEFISPVQGVRCQSCKATIEKKLSKISGITQAHVSVIHSRLSIQYDENLVKPEDFIAVVKSLGYSVVDKASEERPVHHSPMEEHHDHDMANPLQGDLMEYSMDMGIMGMKHGSSSKKEKSSGSWKSKRIWFNLCLSIVVIVLALGFSGVISEFVQWILTTFIVVSEWNMFRVGFRGLRNLHPNMYSLIALGSGVGYLYSILILLGRFFIPAFFQDAPLFFDATAAVLSFLAIGEFAQAKGMDFVRKNLGNLQNDFPLTITRLLANGTEEVVPLQKIFVGDQIIVKSGEMISFDGILQSEKAEVVETIISGENSPVIKHKGDSLTSGTYAQNTAIVMEVSKSLQEGFFYKIRSSLIEIEQRKTPVLELVDKISYYFVPLVILFSLGSFLFWGLSGDSWLFALNSAIATLVIACPCALGLATPFAIMVFFGSAFKGGFLLRNSRILSFVDLLDTCLIDKTGTLTVGEPHVVEWGIESDAVLVSKIFSMEGRSTHPYARAILDHIKTNSTPSFQAVQNFHIKEGLGVSGEFNGESVDIGNSQLVTLSEEEQKKENEYTKKGKTVLWVRSGEKNCGYIVLEDSLRAGAKEWVSFAKKRYRKGLEILSGDNTASVAFVANELGIKDFHGNMKPFDKLEKVKELQQSGHHVLMIGDGVNDSLVQAQADLSFSLGEKSNLGGQSGDIISLTRNLSHFITLIHFAKKTNRIILQNLFWAFCYNIVLLPWAMGFFVPLGWGHISPVVGAIGMASSSLIVVLNSLRLYKFRG